MIILVFSISFFCIVIVAVTIVNIFLSKYTTRKMKANEKSTILRHKKNEYTPNEANVIRQICTEELFPYYVFYCPNDNTWIDLLEKLDSDEKVVELTVVLLKMKGFISRKYPLSVLFITNKARIFVYQMSFFNLFKSKAKCLMTINLNDILEIDYKIEHQMAQMFKYTVPSTLFLKLEGNKVLSFQNTACPVAEQIREMVWQVAKIEVDPDETAMMAPDRIIKKLDELHNKEHILTEKYKIMKNKARVSCKQLRKKIWEERFYS